jgi:hypothetical protein
MSKTDKPYKIEYGLTFNMGNYQSEKFGVEAEFSADTDPADAVLELEAAIVAMRIATRKSRQEASNGQ